MKEFTTVALPWVLAGIAIALICASFSKTKRTKKQEEWEKERKRERKLETRMAVGMLIGLLAGVAVSKLDLFEWENRLRARLPLGDGNRGGDR